MKTALIAFVILGIAAGFGPSARADSDDQHHQWHHHYNHDQVNDHGH